MSGAIRPPWIDKEDFYHMPFNYCDRWCEKCQLTNLCRVFKREEESKKKWVKAGKDPDSWDYVFNTIKESFEEVRGLIKKDANRLGIDLSAIDYSKEKGEPLPKNFTIYRLSNKFAQAIKRTLKDLEGIPVDVDEDLVVRSAEILSYYSTLIPAKVYRAILSRAEEKEDPKLAEACPDSRNSAFIIVNALSEIIYSLTEVIGHSPLRPIREKLFHLRKVAINLKEAINAEFEVEEEERLN